VVTTQGARENTGLQAGRRRGTIRLTLHGVAHTAGCWRAIAVLRPGSCRTKTPKTPKTPSRRDDSQFSFFLSFLKVLQVQPPIDNEKNERRAGRRRAKADVQARAGDSASSLGRGQGAQHLTHACVGGYARRSCKGQLRRAHTLKSTLSEYMAPKYAVTRLGL
jgi:hypothetical protein